MVRIAALLVQPVMPTAAATLLDLLGQPGADRRATEVGAPTVPGTALPPPAPDGVFPALSGEVTCIPSCCREPLRSSREQTQTSRISRIFR